MQKKVQFSIFLSIFIVIFAGCATKKEIYTSLDFLDINTRQYEILEIKKRIPQNIIESLWRASVLKNAYSEADEEIDSLIAEIYENIKIEFDTAVEKNLPQKALDIYTSIEACDPSKLTILSLPKKKLTEMLLSSFLPHMLEKNQGDVRIAQMIKGTVTIWVDMGFKIDRGRGFVDRSLGSGFFIDKRGYVITNYHVIASKVDPKYEGYSRVYVKLSHDIETRVPAKVVGWDKALDLALLKIEVDAPHVFPLGSSKDLDVGDSIYAIGSPVGLESTITSGIVSSKDRKLFSMGQVMQIDAAINSGNSGGPIVDKSGSVQAVVFAGIEQFEGLNFAVPIEYLKSILARLYAAGKVDHGWLGLYGKTYRDFAGKGSGVEVLYSMPGGTAFRSGLKKGNVITAIDGVAVTSVEDLQNLLIAKSNQTILKVTAHDEDKQITQYSVYFDTRPEQPGYEIYKRDTLANAFLPIFGMELVPTSGSKKFYIGGLLKSSIADESGFSVQDPIEVNRISFYQDNQVMVAEVFTKKRKGGYLDLFLTLPAYLDNTNYF
ncbi:MAG: S1C family serine protease [Treponemataceae bacterium]